jgi:hypothetical protein
MMKMPDLGVSLDLYQLHIAAYAAEYHYTINMGVPANPVAWRFKPHFE